MKKKLQSDLNKKQIIRSDLKKKKILSDFNKKKNFSLILASHDWKKNSFPHF